MAIPLDIVEKLQKKPERIRNICVLAHVDHGKTTLSDCLISSNGIISSRSAGTIRYLDNRKDEQERRITMKSSAITLLYDHKAEPENQIYLINLIDSPGHVDFSSEVSTATRISDGCLILVDVLEGVCVQTGVVLRQAWKDRVKPCLVLNKIDRLITEMELTPEMAYEHLEKILQQVNAVTAGFWNEEMVSKRDIEELQNEEDDSDLYFSPDKGNVAFGSAIDGWAFTIEQFADLYSKKLGMKKEILQKTLWGNYYYNSKQKKVLTKSQGKLQPMFVQFVLNQIWEVYNSCLEVNLEKKNKIRKALGLDIPDRDFHHKDIPTVLKSTFGNWLPLSSAVLSMVVGLLPNPIEAQGKRIDAIWKPLVSNSQKLNEAQEKIYNDMKKCDSSDKAEVMIYVSKVYALGEDSSLARRTVKEGDDKIEEFSIKDMTDVPFVGVARIFSGTLKRGSKVHVLGPKYNPLFPEKHSIEISIGDLYLLMGRCLEHLEEISAGNVFGIGGVGGTILKTASLCSTKETSTFTGMQFVSPPILRVAVETIQPSEMPKLIQGLQLLNQADPCVEVAHQDSGEHVIIAAGELHLTRCLRDLKEDFAKVEFRVSEPIVPFKETVTTEMGRHEQTGISYSKKEETIGKKTPNKAAQIKIKAIPIPNSLSVFLDQNGDKIKEIFVKKAVLGEDGEMTSPVTQEEKQFLVQLQDECLKAGKKFAKFLPYLWCFGPKRMGTNMFINKIPGYFDSEHFKSVFSLKMDPEDLYKEEIIKDANKIEETETNGEQKKKKKKKKIDRSGWEEKGEADQEIKQILIEKEKEKEKNQEEKIEEEEEEEIEEEEEELEDEDEDIDDIDIETKIPLLKKYERSVISGFQVASSAGPLCDEPMFATCFIIEDIRFLSSNPELGGTYGPFSGQVISSVKEGCRKAFLRKSSRLVEPIYLCELQVTDEAVGKIYAVLGRRRAKILSDVVKDGTSIFSIQALLPVAESFGLSDEILGQSSGAATVQLMFHSWQLLDEDPDFVAKTDEELEDIGENLGGIAPNKARTLIDQVRKRKGLPVRKKLVEAADKQRTIAKKK